MKGFQHEAAKESTAKPKAGIPVMPFNEALKRVWASPPQPNVKPKKKTGK